MPVIHTSRTGKAYYLHSGLKRGGGEQYFFSTKSSGSLVEQVPDGFEIYESINGQVFLRRQAPKIIHDEEMDLVRRGIEGLRTRNLYKIDVRGETLTVFESANRLDSLTDRSPWISSEKVSALREQFAYYQAVMRFILVDAEKRLFAPERYCFRGQVEDWISIGPSEPIGKLAAKYFKHLGRESFFELY